MMEPEVNNPIEVAEEPKEQGSYGTGLLGAILGATVGAVVWGLLILAGWISALVGLLIAWLAEKGYDLVRGRQGKGKLVILICSVILGVLLGFYFGEVFDTIRMILAGEGLFAGRSVGEAPLLAIAYLIYDTEYAAWLAGQVLKGLLFAGLGSFMLLKSAHAKTAKKEPTELEQ